MELTEEEKQIIRSEIINPDAIADIELILIKCYELKNHLAGDETREGIWQNLMQGNMRVDKLGKGDELNLQLTQKGEIYVNGLLGNN